MWKDRNIKLTVINSKCEHYKTGDTIYIEGPMVNSEKSVHVCLTAINAIYPFVYALRKGATKEQLGFDELIFQCPDCPDTVQFAISTLD